MKKQKSRQRGMCKMLTKGEKTKTRIINASKKLFGTKTYDYVTTRMIAAEARCSQSAISFYFSTKENLCRAVIEDIIKYHKIYYTPLAESVKETEKQGLLTKEKAISLLQQYIHTQLNIAFDPRNRCAISFSVNGQDLPGGVSHKITESVFNNVTLPMAKLICAFSPMPLDKALVYSQTITNCIVTYPFTEPMPYEVVHKYSVNADTVEYNRDRTIHQVEQYIMDFCMTMVEAIKA